MAVTANSQPCTQGIVNEAVTILPALANVGTTLAPLTATTNVLNCANGGTNGSLVKSFMICSDDSTARVLVIYLDLTGAGTTLTPIGAINVPINSGQSGAIANIDVLNSTVLLGFPVDQSGRSVVALQPSAKLWIGSQTTLTAAKSINVVVSREAF